MWQILSLYKLITTNQSKNSYKCTNPGLCVTQFQISQLIAEVSGRAATVENSIAEFRGN